MTQSLCHTPLVVIIQTSPLHSDSVSCNQFSKLGGITLCIQKDFCPFDEFVRVQKTVLIVRA